MIKGKNKSLQCYRGLACVMVFFSHAFGMRTGGRITIPFFHLFYDGSIGVRMFWVLGGYLAVQSYRGSTTKDYLYYIIKKIVRLYPLYIISLLLGTFLCNLNIYYKAELVSSWGASFWNSKIYIADIIRLLILRGDFNLVNPPVWTMKYEINMVFVLPLVISLIKVLRKELLCCTCFTAIIAILGIALSNGTMQVMSAFCIGIIYGLSEGKNFWEHILKHQLIVWIITIILINCKNIQYFNILDDVLKEYITAIGAMILLALIKNVESTYMKIFRNKVSCFLGDISYEIYLFHFPVLLSLRYFGYSARRAWITILIASVIIIICSTALHYINAWNYSYMIKKISGKIYKV